MFEANISYLSDKHILLLVEKLELKDSFPFEKFEYGKKMSDQPREVQSFFDGHIGDIALTPEEVIPSLIQRVFKMHIKNKIFSWRDISLNDIYTTLSVTAAENTNWLFDSWDKESVLLWKQSEEMQKQVQQHLESMNLGDDNAGGESN